MKFIYETTIELNSEEIKQAIYEYMRTKCDLPNKDLISFRFNTDCEPDVELSFTKQE